MDADSGAADSQNAHVRRARVTWRAPRRRDVYTGEWWAYGILGHRVSVRARTVRNVRRYLGPLLHRQSVIATLYRNSGWRHFAESDI